jgi:hypothetical protein
MTLSESACSAKYLMVFGIKFNPFLENGGRFKMSTLKPKLGNKKDKKSLKVSPVARKYCVISFLFSSK